MGGWISHPASPLAVPILFLVMGSLRSRELLVVPDRAVSEGTTSRKLASDEWKITDFDLLMCLVSDKDPAAGCLLEDLWHQGHICHAKDPAGGKLIEVH